MSKEVRSPNQRTGVWHFGFWHSAFFRVSKWARPDTATKCNAKERGARTPRELAAGTAALRSAGVLACEFWQRPAANLVVVSRCALSTFDIRILIARAVGSVT